MPLFFWLGALAYLFISVEWAYQYPLLAVLLLTPSYCTMNSKLIVCSFTNMEINSFNPNMLIFTLFPLNKTLLDGAIPEWQIAGLIAIFEYGLYLTFVVYTTSQMTEFLGIHCLSIK